MLLYYHRSIFWTLSHFPSPSTPTSSQVQWPLMEVQVSVNKWSQKIVNYFAVVLEPPKKFLSKSEQWLKSYLLIKNRPVKKLTSWSLLCFVRYCAESRSRLLEIINLVLNGVFYFTILLEVWEEWEESFRYCWVF